MNKRQFERFKEAYRKIQTDYIEWDEYFYKNKTINFSGEELSVAEYFEFISKFEKYEEIPKYVIAHDEAGSNYFAKYVEEMEQSIKSQNVIDGKNDDLGDSEESVEQADSNFFSRMRGELREAKRNAKWNSSEFGAMRNKVREIDNYLRSTEEVDNEKYFKMLDDLEVLADVYLKRKVATDTNSRSLGKIRMAAEIKEYIAERRVERDREIIKEKLDSRINAKKHFSKAYAGYDSKQAEIIGTKSVFDEVITTAQVSDETKSKISDLLWNAQLFMQTCSASEGDFGGKNTIDDKYKKDIAAVLLSDFIQHEMIAAGGATTPFLKKLFENPDAVITELEGVTKFFQQNENFLKLIYNDSKEVVFLAYEGGLAEENEDHVFATLSDPNYLIKNEKDMARKGNLYEKVEDKDVNYAKAYSILAKVAKDNNIVIKGEKMDEKYDNLSKVRYENVREAFVAERQIRLPNPEFKDILKDDGELEPVEEPKQVVVEEKKEEPKQVVVEEKKEEVKPAEVVDENVGRLFEAVDRYQEIRNFLKDEKEAIKKYYEEKSLRWIKNEGEILYAKYISACAVESYINSMKHMMYSKKVMDDLDNMAHQYFFPSPLSEIRNSEVYCDIVNNIPDDKIVVDRKVKFPEDVYQQYRTLTLQEQAKKNGEEPGKKGDEKEKEEDELKEQLQAQERKMARKP